MEYHRFKTRMACVGADNNPASLKDYFIQNGLEVVDHRMEGGALWVVGTRAQIGDIVRRAGSLYHAGGTYMEAGGRSVQRRAAWFTKCRR